MADRVARLAGAEPIGWRRIRGGGYTPAERWVVQFEDGRSAFAKVGVTDLTARWLRDEERVYRQIQAGFLPRTLGWDDDGIVPMLLLEDLSEGYWPPPWDEPKVHLVMDTLAEIRSTAPPVGLPSLDSSRGELACWAYVEEDPETFLALGVCTRPWLERSLPVLLRADSTAVLTGDQLVHLDIRSDNICFVGHRTVLVDWNQACIGNARLDPVGWMPSLFLEWGPRAEAVAPHEPELAALMAGYFAHHARLPPYIPNAPRVRGAQLDALRTSLPWACRLLGLAPPDGPALVKGR